VNGGQWNIPELHRLLEEMLPKNPVFSFEVAHSFQGLGQRILLLNARKIFRQGVNKELILLAIEDITEQRRSEEALRFSELRYRRLFESAKDGVLIVNPETRKIIDVNPFMTELLGHSREEFLGKELWEIGLFKDEASNRAAFEQLEHTPYMRHEDLRLPATGGEQ